MLGEGFKNQILKKFTIPHLVLEVVQKQSLWRDEGHGIYNSVRMIVSTFIGIALRLKLQTELP